MTSPTGLRRRILPLAFALAAVACASTESLDSTESAAARREWRPSAVGRGDWVWIRLDTDEWLKGELIVLRNDSLQFDSDNLGKLTIDWEDVVEIYSRRKTEILLENNERLVGSLSLADNVVTVTDEEGRNHVFPRKELRGAVPDARREVDHWTGKISAGLGFRSGNSDQVDGSVDLDITRRTIDTRFEVKYLANYSEANDEVIVTNSRFNTKFDVFLTWQLFLTLASVEVYRDPIVNIAWQITPGCGVGYTIVDEPAIDWEVTAGVGYQYTQYDSVESGEDRTQGRTSTSFGTSFDYEITSDLDFELDYSFLLGVPKTEYRQHHLVSKLVFEVTDTIDFEVTFTWDRTDPTVADDNGVVPEPDDFRLSLGLGVDF